MFQEWCNKTSLNGIIDLYEARCQKWRFSFWLLVMLLMLCLTIYLTVLNIVSYIASPTVTNVFTVPQNNNPMPDVVLCYKGGMNEENMKKFHLSESMLKAWRGNYMGDKAFNNTDTEEEFNQFLKRYDMTVEEFFLNVTSFNCNKIIEKRMEAGDFFNDLKCTNVSKFVGRYGRPCLLMKENGIQRWPNPSDGGTRLTVKSPKPNFTMDSDHPNIMNSFDVAIEKKIITAVDKVYQIPLNYIVYVYLKLVHHVRLNKVKPCNGDTTFTSSNSLRSRCLFNSIWDSCQCACPGLTIPNLDSKKNLCNIFEFKRKCNLKAIMEASYPCATQQIVLCEEFEYQASISYAPFQNERVNNITNVYISFASMGYTQVKYSKIHIPSH